MKCVLPVLFALLAAIAPSRAEVVISEFLAENDGGIRDADGSRSDWIELFNNGAASVDLTGWRLTDDAGSPAKWQFPAVIVAAGARMVVFASGKDRRVPGAELHTNFSLNKAGEYLALRMPDGTVATEYSPAFPPQKANVSFGSGMLADGEDLVFPTSAGKWFVPPNGALGQTWTEPGFNDAAWNSGTSRLGYQSGSAGPGQPITYWTFDDVATNEIPGGPAATLNGATYSPSVPGAIGGGSSLHFSSSENNYVSAALDVSETDYTCSLWFRTGSPNIGIFTVTDGDLGSGGYDRLMYLTGGNIAARTWSEEVIVSAGKNYADGQWHHLAHVFGGSVGGQKLFVDGVQVAAGAKSLSNFDWQQRINIGFTNDATGNTYFNGEIDDVAIWSEALNMASIRSLAAGTSPIELVGFGPYIATNTQAAMLNVNASAYVRLPFTVSRATPFNAATLRMRYDDAFVAYIDGVEIARRNVAAGTPAYHENAVSVRPTNEAIYFETIDISASANLLGNGAHVLAIHALNDSAASLNFLLNAELSASTITQETAIYLDPPTPGLPNSTGFAGFVADTNFLPKRGFYSTAQNIVVSSATPGATIAYTTNGTDPSPTNGTQVSAPNGTTPPSVTLPVNSTGFIRAMAFKTGSGMRATNVDSHTYIFTSRVLTQSNSQPGFNAQWNGRTADYAVDPNVVNTTLPGYSMTEGLLSLPSISMTCLTGDLFDAPNGIYYNTGLRGPSAEREASIEWINPDGSPGWHAQCGTRVHGNSSRGHSFTPKHTLRLHFRDIYGDSKLRKDIFGGGVAKFDEILLRACSTDSMPVVDGDIDGGEQRWNNDKATYMRDQYMRDVLNDLGHPNCRGKYVHLYINGLYWGLYNIAERPTSSYFAETFGGDKDEWDVMKDFQEIADGDATAWNEMRTIATDTHITDAVRCQKLIGNNPDGTRNPAFPIYIHWPSFRDYMIAHIAAGAEDWPDHNYWAGRRRGPLGDGFHFVAWDQEISNDSLTRTRGRGTALTFATAGGSPGDDGFQFGPAKIYDKFRRVEPFKTEFRERIHALLFNGGPLTPTANRARWGSIQATINRAMVCESARWGDAAGEGVKKRETTWLNNMNYMNAAGTGYWDAILPIDVQRFRSVGLYPSIDQPAFSQNGGNVSSGFQLFLTHANSHVYYTLDGSDPMGPGGAPSAQALLYDGGLMLTSSSMVTARARTRIGEWSGKNSAYFNVGNAAPSAENVIVSELHYHPAAPVRSVEISISTDPDDFEFVELMNIGAGTVDMTGVTFSAGVEFAFPTGFTLAPGGRCVVVRNQPAFEARYGIGRNIAGAFANGTSLSNSGETITIIDAGGGTLKSFTYSDLVPWPKAADGGGPSLVLINPGGNPDQNLAANWTLSADFGGTPGESAAQQTFARWRNAYDETLTLTGNRDGDALSDALEYALARNPLIPDPAGTLPPAQLVTDGGLLYPAITFRRRAAAADLAIEVQVSANLTTWNGAPQTVLMSAFDHGDGTVTETWRSATPHAPETKQFLRIRATITP